MKIIILQGDITEQTTDAIVNAANNHLWMGSGVAGAIKRKGGQIIEDEAVAKGPIKAGDAIETQAGKLKAKYVIHAAGMGQDLQTSEELVRKTTQASLEVAEYLKLKSISFPAIGTGVGGLNMETCARVMLEAVWNFNCASVNKICFVLFDNKSREIFEDQYKELI